MQDSIVDEVLRKYVRRSYAGQEKYKTTLDRTDLSELEWLKHTQEEMMDGVLYLEKLIQMKGASRGHV